MLDTEFRTGHEPETLAEVANDLFIALQRLVMVRGSPDAVQPAEIREQLLISRRQIEAWEQPQVPRDEMPLAVIDALLSVIRAG